MGQKKHREEDGAPQIERALEIRRPADDEQRLQLAELVWGKDLLACDGPYVGDIAAEVVDVPRRNVSFTHFGEQRRQRREQFLARAERIKVQQPLGRQALLDVRESLCPRLMHLPEPG